MLKAECNFSSGVLAPNKLHSIYPITYYTCPKTKLCVLVPIPKSVMFINKPFLPKQPIYNSSTINIYFS